MKKLEKLRLHNFEKICVDEQKVLHGGGVWVPGPDGNTYYTPGETVTSSTGNGYILVAQLANDVPIPRQVTWKEWGMIAEASSTAAKLATPLQPYGPAIAYITTALVLWVDAYFTNY